MRHAPQAPRPSVHLRAAFDTAVTHNAMCEPAYLAACTQIINLDLQHKKLLVGLLEQT